jgi:tetratricopeptide (TPR) repeat protein
MFKRMLASTQTVSATVYIKLSKTSEDWLPSDSLAPPTTLLWAYYYLALHLAHPLNPSPAYKRALDLLSIALEHTPTLPEIHMAKAMVLKRAGDAQGAAEAMEEARLLDGQDRFLNGKAAKYWLRAGDVKKAEDLVAMFTKVSASRVIDVTPIVTADAAQKDMTAVADLTDLQCLWFLQEEGDAYRRNGNLAMALKRYQALVNVRWG